MLRKLKIWHPFLISVFPVIFLYSNNINEVSFEEVIKPFVVVFLFVIIFWFFLKLILKDLVKAGILTSFYTLLFFSYGYFCGVFGEVYSFDESITFLFHLGLWISLYIFLAYVVVKNQINLLKVNNFLNATSVFLVALSFVNIFRFVFLNKHSGTNAYGNYKNLSVYSEGDFEKNLPDIYYIILDRYGRNDVLKKHFGYDNREFTDFLEHEGFYVASDSTSNYLKTAHSLASSLNMDYINFLQKDAGENSSDWKPLYSLIKENKVMNLLKDRGYKIYHFGSWWEPTSSNENADVNVNLYPLSDFSMVLYKNTFLYPFGTMLELFDIRIIQWERINYQFDELEKVSEDKNPTFVFAHLIIPHPPYVFDENGDFLKTSVERERSGAGNYINQLKFVNSKMKEFVSLVKNASSSETVIIIQSDEGIYPERYERDLVGFDWFSATDDELILKMSILNAFYFSGHEHTYLDSETTPVNIFRQVFNVYFGENYEFLPNKNYIFQDQNHPYKFQEVTMRLKEKRQNDQ